MRKNLKKKKVVNRYTVVLQKASAKGSASFPRWGALHNAGLFPFQMQVTRGSVFPQKCLSPASQPSGRRAAPSSLGSPRPQQLQSQTQICSAVASSEQPARCRGHRRSSPGSPGSLRWPGIQVSPSRHTEPSPSHTTGPKGGAGSPAERSGRDQRRSALRSRPRLAQCLLAGSQALRCTWSPRRPLWASGLLASASSTATQAVFAISQAGGAHGRPDMGKKLLLRSNPPSASQGRGMGGSSGREQCWPGAQTTTGGGGAQLFGSLGGSSLEARVAGGGGSLGANHTLC